MHIPGPIAAAKQRQIDPIERVPHLGKTIMQTNRRWLKSVIAASLEPQVALPWQRGNRKKPAAMKPAQRAERRVVAMAAR